MAQAAPRGGAAAPGRAEGLRRARRPARRVGARVALAGLVVTSVAMALGAAGGRSPWAPSSRGGFPDWMAGPLAGLTPGTHGGDSFWLLVMAMGVCYLAALALAREIGPRLAIATVVGMHVVFLLAPPLLTTDPFGYLAYARLTILEDVSPYTFGLSELGAGDPVRRFYGWERGPSPYGPLFTVASLGLVPLGLAGGLWAFKVMGAVGSLATLALVWRLAPRLGRSPVPALVYAGLNPVVLVWGVGGAHNDMVVAAVVLASLALIARGREGLGGAVAGLAVGIKASAGLLLPLLVLGVRERGRALAGVVAGLAVGGGVGLLALGPAGLAGYPAALAEQAAYVTDKSLVHVVGVGLGLGRASDGVRLGANVVLAVGMALLCVGAIRSRGRPDSEQRLATAWGWATLLALLTTTWLMVWYAVLVLPLAALVPDRRLKLATLALCVFMVLMRVPLTSFEWELPFAGKAGS